MFVEPNGHGTKIEINWLRWQIEKDDVARRTFTETHYGLCHEPSWTVYRKQIE
ncbi:MAG: hypothetical protein JST84_31940 [Acidobacteria bacterium]|nr:hypothetical protein [Acidobacteriota bacterium]